MEGFKSPLTQFEIWVYQPSSYNYWLFILQPLWYIFSNITWVWMAALFFYFYWFFIIKAVTRLSRGGVVNIITDRIIFLYTLFLREFEAVLLGQAGLLGSWWVPYIFTVFTSILICNFLSLLPYGFAITATVVTPFHLSLVINLYLFLVGPVLNGSHFFLNFIPSSAPLILKPFITIIEVLSYLMRCISLGMRLSANLLSGHILLYIIGLYVFLCTCTTTLVFSGFLGILSFYLAVCVIEFLIAAVQAYVFAVLIAVYLSDAVKAKH